MSLIKAVKLVIMGFNLQKPSIQSLRLEVHSDGHMIASGTGFIIDSPVGPVLLTNRHIVTGLDNFTGKLLDHLERIPTHIQIAHNKKNSLGKWVLKTEPLLKNGKPPMAGTSNSRRER
jgi:hypothetical protein